MKSFGLNPRASSASSSESALVPPQTQVQDQRYWGTAPEP